MKLVIGAGVEVDKFGFGPTLCEQPPRINGKMRDGMAYDFFIGNTLMNGI